MNFKVYAPLMNCYDFKALLSLFTKFFYKKPAFYQSSPVSYKRGYCFEKLGLWLLNLLFLISKTLLSNQSFAIAMTFFVCFSYSNEPRMQGTG